MDRLALLNTETCRLAGTATRMMATFQQGAATLQRLRTGGTQRVVVEHMQQVTVEEGGQAVVAGNVEQRRRTKSPTGGRL
jgi:hypothetical protein